MLAKTSTISVTGEKGEKNTIVGRSRAGEGTCFALTELKWMFDCGALIQGWKPRIIFLSHTHSDHVHFLTHNKDEKRPPLIYLPTEAESFVKAHLIAHQEMTDCMAEVDSQQENGGKYKVEYTLRATEPGEEITFRQGGIDYIVRTLKMEHRIPCLGYSIFRLKSSLRNEYAGLSGKEIGKLRKEGVQVTQTAEVPLICFFGDSTSAVFDRYPEILNQHRIVIIECSFIDKGDLERAETTKHMHWDHLEPHVEKHPDTFFILIHFSLKYSTLSLREFFCEQQKKYNNIHPMLVEEEVEQQWIRKNDASNKKEEIMMPSCQCRMCKPID